MKIISSLFIILSGFLLFGCASISDKASITNQDVTIRNVNSNLATINQVDVKSSPAGTIIHGKLRKKYLARGPVPGHLDITITRPDGTVQYKGVMDYMRNNRKSAYSNFSVSLDAGLVKNSVILIKHHESANIIDKSRH